MNKALYRSHDPKQSEFNLYFEKPEPSGAVVWLLWCVAGTVFTAVSLLAPMVFGL